VSQEFDDRALKDEEFDEYLRRSSEVSQRYQELGAREVPPALDAKVLRQAQQQAAKSSGRRRPWLRWGAPLAFAATALIAITVVMQPEVNAPSAPQLVADSPVAESPKLVVGDYEMSAESQDEQLAAVPEKQQAGTKEDAVAGDVFRDRRAAQPAAATQPPQSQPAAAGSGSARPASSVARDRVLQDAVAVPNAQRESNDDAREGNARRLLSGPAAPADPDRRIEELITTRPAERRIAQAQESASKPALDQFASASPAESKRKQEESRAKAEEAAPPVPAPAPAAAQPPPPRAVAAQEPPLAGPLPPAPAPEGVSTLEVDRTVAPAAWVRWIREFRAQGNQPRAQELLKRLRAAHPSFELPADIAPPAQQR
jgi:hypothetical protein